MSRGREKVRSAFVLCFTSRLCNKKCFDFIRRWIIVYLPSSSGWLHTYLFAPPFNDIINDEVQPRGCEKEHY
jgi:hypothetical protein